MAKEQYVTYETAKLLKEKGFPQSTSICNVVYKPNGKMSFNAKSFINPHYFFKDCYIFAPTQQMALCWLREEHDIDIIPVIRHSLKYAQESPFRDYACRVYDCDGNTVLSATKWYSRYENAVEAALQYCLTNLI